ncbi:hypothetical protein [Desertibacillus haloalkaliphilus]|uniref:hypothetical protein n=1 Tax=Desertibacillus haloalkaliphilus TaxID=1328930 RepID=UPI001C2654C7|nr:hypothetical protein [Desertibacillus haloalkaliphilus]MBU8908990.1 hypothetical protein [Desertibacillus haloalkaliphilus]
MKIRYGVEMKSPEGKSPGFISQMIRKTNEVAKIIDRDQQLAVVETYEEAKALAAFYDENDMLEEEFGVYYLEDPEVEESFSDYGFVSNSGQSYLYKETTIPFKITGGLHEQIDMSLLQMAEDLIAKDKQGDVIYFVDRQFEDLIIGYANAYEITVKFITK